MTSTLQPTSTAKSTGRQVQNCASNPSPIDQRSPVIQQEQEAKFRVTPAQLVQLATPETSLTGYTLDTRKQTPTIDYYLDNSSYCVLRHGYALRIRRNDDQAEIGLKHLTDLGSGVIQQRGRDICACCRRKRPQFRPVGYHDQGLAPPPECRSQDLAHAGRAAPSTPKGHRAPC